MAKTRRSSEQDLDRLAELTVIPGIGGKKARVLREAGISDLETLAGAPRKRLKKLFPSVKKADLARWKKEARKGAKDQEKAGEAEAAATVLESAVRWLEEDPAGVATFAGLLHDRGDLSQRLLKELGGAVRPAPSTADDFTVLRGIGPARVRVLNAAGVSDFTTLSRTSKARLQKLFPRVKDDDLTRWKKEARSLVATGDLFL